MDTGVADADATLVAAVDLARATAEQEAPGLVGDYVGVEVDEERLVTERVDHGPEHRGRTIAREGIAPTRQAAPASASDTW